MQLYYYKISNKMSCLFNYNFFMVKDKEKSKSEK